MAYQSCLVLRCVLRVKGGRPGFGAHERFRYTGQLCDAKQTGNRSASDFSVSLRQLSEFYPTCPAESRFCPASAESQGWT